MSKPGKAGNCTTICWALSALAGVLVLWWASGVMSLLGAVLLGFVLGGLLGLALTRVFCTAVSASGGEQAETPTVTPPAAAPTLPAAALSGPGPEAGKAAPASAGPAPTAGAARTPAGTPAQPEKRPAALTGPRDDKADDLKEIKGIGPKLEVLCHDLGIWHFDQIAGWGADEVAWMDENLTGFRGRVSRDDWVAQAKMLAARKERT